MGGSWSPAEASPAKSTGSPSSGPDTKALIANCLDPLHPACKARLEGRHFIGSGDMRKNCAVCYHTWPVKQSEKQVYHFCKQCSVYMHVDCFEAWHTKLVPLSPRVLEDKKRFTALVRKK
mmetsp:Transcript_24803/g.50349  ORF Transcript_24803/g.50349 Transcript_24803/m.50349 type:complete len:120 (-) Transcript_24803:63-422(-)